MKTAMKITAYISMYSETKYSFDDQGYDFCETLAVDEYVRKDFIKPWDTTMVLICSGTTLSMICMKRWLGKEQNR